MNPGEIIVADGDIVLNQGRRAITLKVANQGDRPIQVGSHYHFFETNEALAFDRKAARARTDDRHTAEGIRNKRFRLISNVFML